MGSRWVPAFSAAMVLSSTLLCVSLLVYFNNIAEFQAPTGDILTGASLFACSVAAATFAVLLFFPRRMLGVVSGLCLLLCVSFWLQATVFDWNVGVLTGKQIDWNQHGYKWVIDALLWGSSIAAALAFRRAISANLLFLSLVFIAVQIVTVGSKFDLKDEVPSYQKYTISEQGKFSFSKNRNVVILLLDSFQADVFQQLIDENPGLQFDFADFTYFRNVTAQYSKTYGAVPGLLTGIWYENEQPIQAYLQSSFDSALSKKLMDKGWDARLYPAVPRVIGYSEKFASNIQPRANRKGLFRDLAYFYDIGLFQGAPGILKPHIFNDGRWLLAGTAGMMELASSGASHDNGASKLYFHPIQKFVAESQSLLRADSTAPTFKFFHYPIPHAPFSLNEDLEVEQLPKNREGFVRYSMAALVALKSFIRDLKAAGVYENTMILVLSDHGGGEYRTGIYNTRPVNGNAGKIYAVPHQSGLPLLLIKQFGDGVSKLRVSDAPVSLADVLPTVQAALGIPLGYEGRDVFSVAENEDRERRYLYYSFAGWNHLYLPSLREYVIRGHALEPASWVETGRTFAPPEVAVSSPSAKFEIGRTYHFSNNAYPEYFDSSWHDAEDQGRWSKDRSLLRLKTGELPQGMYRAEFDLFPFACSGVDKEEGFPVFLKVGSSDKTVARLSGGGKISALFSAGDVDNGVLEITFRAPRARSPMDCKTGPDARLLGVFLTAMRLDAVDVSYTLGTSIDLGASSADRFIGAGWSTPEGTHRWSASSLSTLMMSVNPNPSGKLSLRLYAQAYPVSGKAFRQVGVRVNGKRIADWSMAGAAWYEAMIPEEIAAGGLLNIDFEINEPTSPCEISESKDCRKLGIAARELVIVKT